MNKDNAKDYLPLVQALAEGKELQFRINESYPWDSPDHFGMEYSPDCYRIKPEPNEIWMNRYPRGPEGGPYQNKEEAATCSADGAIQVRYREVIE